MQLYKGTGCQILLIGRLQSMPMHDKETQSFFVILERKKPYYDSVRQFLQEDITWFRVSIHNEDAKQIRELAEIGTSIAVSGDLINQQSVQRYDYTACMPEIIAENIDFIPKSPTGSFAKGNNTKQNIAENHMLH